MDLQSYLGIEINTDDVEALWDGDATARAFRAEKKKYYDGKHKILERKEKYGDGTEKSNTVMNWIDHIVSEHAGAISSYQVSSESEEEKPATDEYKKVAENNFLDSKDLNNRRKAILYGYGVEVHSFDPKEKKIIIKNYDSNEWLFLRDSDDVLTLAIRWVTLPDNTIHNGKLLKDPLEVVSVYSQQGFVHLERLSETEWAVSSNGRHSYGRIPVVQWRVDEDSLGIITKALISQNDEYNVVDSANGDSVKIDVDSVLKLKGVDSSWANENETTIREKRMLPLPFDSDAEYMSRTFDTVRTQDRLDRTRKHIHIMGRIPDVANIVGTTGATSGIALKLMFSPMQREVESMISFLKQGVADRIALMNAIWAKLGQPVLTDFTTTIQFLMPVNRIEEWQNINGLEGVVSKKTKLELLTDIIDPEKEYEALMEDGAVGMEAEEIPSDEQAKNTEARQNENDIRAIDFEGMVGDIVENLSMGVIDYLVKTKAIERLSPEG